MGLSRSIVRYCAANARPAAGPHPSPTGRRRPPGNGQGRAPGRRRPVRTICVGLAVLLTALLVLPGTAAGAGRPTAGAPDGGTAAVLATAVTAAAPAPGTFVTVPNTRLADTRYGTGTPQARIPAGGTLVLQVGGRAGLPAAGIGAVALTINVVNPAHAGRLIAYAAGTTRPNIASVNFSAPAGSTTSVASRLSATGGLALANSSAGPIDVIVDVDGYWAGGTVTLPGGLVPLPPSRILDTRNGTGAVRSDWQDVVSGLYESLSWQVTGRGGVPAGATAVLMELTATAVVNTGQFVPFDDDPSLTPGVDPVLVISDSHYVPVTGTAFTGGVPVTALYLVPLSAAGRVRVDLGSEGPVDAPGTDLLADVLGYVRGGGAQQPGTYQPLPVGELSTVVVPAGSSVDVSLPVAGGSTASLALTASSTRPGGLVVYPRGSARPGTRNLNLTPGRRVSGGVLVGTSSASMVTIATTASAPVTVTIDLLGAVRGQQALPPDTVWAAGLNFGGGMGLGFASAGSDVPAPAGISGVTAVASAAGSSYAITADGSLWSWGRNNQSDVLFESGQLGIGNTQDQTLPVRVTALSHVKQIDASYPNGFALQADGTVWQWGGEGSGEVDSPQQVGNLADVTSIDHDTAVKSDGTVWTVSYVGDFDTGCPASGCFTATPIAGLTGIAQVSGPLALRTDGVLEYWGGGGTPTVISNLSAVRTLAGNAVLRTDGTVWLVPVDGSPLATQVPGLTGVTTLGARAVKADGSVWVFSAAGATRQTNLPPAAQVPPSADLIVAR